MPLPRPGALVDGVLAATSPMGDTIPLNSAASHAITLDHSSDPLLNALSHVKGAKPIRRWNRCIGHFNCHTLAATSPMGDTINSPPDQLVGGVLAATSPMGDTVDSPPPDSPPPDQQTSIMERLVAFVLQNKGSQGPQYLQQDDDNAGFLQLITTSQSGMKGAFVYCRTVKDNKISAHRINELKKDLGLRGAESVEIQGMTGGEPGLVLDICGTKSVEVHKVMGGELVLNIAHCELVGTKYVDLSLCAGSTSTTIPCEIHTISGTLSFCGQIIHATASDPVEIYEVGRKANPGGLGTKKRKSSPR